MNRRNGKTSTKIGSFFAIDGKIKETPRDDGVFNEHQVRWTEVILTTHARGREVAAGLFFPEPEIQ